jgi:hypothetical protein
MGCKRGGKLIGDGGCQCSGYCAYDCPGPCKRDPECRWDRKTRMCFSKTPDMPGVPITKCPWIPTNLPPQGGGAVIEGGGAPFSLSKFFWSKHNP